MYSRIAILTITFFFTASLLFAEGTRTWEQSKYEDFVKGTAHGVAISSVGTLELAPGFKLVASTPSSAVWAAAVGPQQEIYVATGAPARVYRIAQGGQPTAIFQPQELQVQALVVDKNGILYAATNPDGKVYKIEHKTAKTSSKDEKSKPERNGPPLFISIQGLNTFGALHSTRAATSTLRLAITDKSFELPPMANTLSFSKATNPISGFWPLTHREISSRALTAAA